MEFFLPQNLQTQLISYDPTLKKLARTTAAKSKSTKPKFPLGQPYDIIPENVIKTSLVQDAVNLINGEAAKNRLHEFKRFEGTPEERKDYIRRSQLNNCEPILPGEELNFGEMVTHAILYHYESCWYAAWLPPKGQEGQYVYGYSYAYKDLPTAKKMLPYKVKGNVENCEYKTYGRSEFITYQKLVTKQDIINGEDDTNWTIPSLTYDKGGNIRDAAVRFRKALSQTVPTWEDRNSVFARLQENKIAKVLEIDKVIDPEEINTWQPSADSFLKIIDISIQNVGNYYHAKYSYFSDIKHIIDKPFFRKWIQSRCEEVVAQFNDANNSRRDAVMRPWNQITELLQAIKNINNVWPDCPIDYYQTHVDTLLTVRYYNNVKVRTCTWLQQHMPVASYFQILSKFVEDARANLSSAYIDTSLGLSRRHFHEWEDTVSMIESILAAGNTLEPPKRWRITEFHDHVQAEAWKVKNENAALPQDLFPTPIKVQNNDQTWTFFQPVDLHQLATWGQTVRNCVGNASHYADGIKKKKHFIVLAMVDKKPTFTIQLEVNNGMMSVKQIAGVANSRLTDDERQDYTTAFGIALKQRNEELVSISA